jgi:hypothetical protein
MMTSIKSNKRAMEMFMDELAISDLAMPKTHRFITGQKLPESKINSNKNSIANLTVTSDIFNSPLPREPG